FLLLARRRPYSVLDLWLLLVSFAWLCSVALGFGTGAVRFEIGYDVSRVFAVSASTFVLAALLSETTILYGQAIIDRERRLNQMQAVLIHLPRVSELGQNVSMVIHEVSQPLSAIANYAAATIKLADTATPQRLKSLLQPLLEQTARASAIVTHLRDFIARN